MFVNFTLFDPLNDFQSPFIKTSHNYCILKSNKPLPTLHIRHLRLSHFFWLSLLKIFKIFIIQVDDRIIWDIFSYYFFLSHRKYLFVFNNFSFPIKKRLINYFLKYWIIFCFYYLKHIKYIKISPWNIKC